MLEVVEVQENHQLLEKQLVQEEQVVVELELFLLLLVELEQQIQVVVEDQDHLLAEPAVRESLS
jgi:hypothetical protein